MSKFKDYRSLNGSNSRVTKKSRSTASITEVLSKVAESKHFIAVRKSDFREPTGRVVPRNLVPAAALLSTEEGMMYEMFCELCK